MTYTTNMPLVGQNISVTQPLIETNFNVLNTYTSINHVPLNTLNAGKHKFVEMPVGSLPATAAGEITFYSKTTSGLSQLFLTPDASTREVQMTSGDINANFAKLGTGAAYGTPPAGFTQTGGWTFLPGSGGLIMQYGFFGKTAALGSSGQVQFPIAWSAGPTIYSIQISLYRDSGNQTITISSLTPPATTTFNFLSSSSSSDGFYWMAIGK